MATPRDRPFGELPAHAADLARTTAAWSDQWWDDDRALVLAPDGAEYVTDAPEGAERPHLLPPSAWYAYALLRRDAPGDRERALRAIDAVIALQFDEPGTAWHGTFALTAEAPHPPPDAEMWTHYDPNWRQFIGITFLLLLEDVGASLPSATVDRVRDSVHLATRGEPPDRCPPSYTNIALMKAWLLAEAGARLDEPGWVDTGETFAQAVARRFDRHGAFDEYNSPTYYGVDLFTLALWRGRSSSPCLIELGTRLEASLWRDVARWYHAGLGNLCGPFTRAYGMEMHRYVAKLSLLLWCALGRERAPLPPLDASARHGHDLFKGALLATVGTRVPADVEPALVDFAGPHGVEQVIDEGTDRRATGWLDDDVALGAESTSADLSWWDQFHAATAHVRTPDGVAWVRVRVPGPSAARVERGRLVVPWAADADDRATVSFDRPVDIDISPIPLGCLEVDLGASEVELVERTDQATHVHVRRPPDTDTRIEVAVTERPAPVQAPFTS